MHYKPINYFSQVPPIESAQLVKWMNEWIANKFCFLKKMMNTAHSILHTQAMKSLHFQSDINLYQLWCDIIIAKQIFLGTTGIKARSKARSINHTFIRFSLVCCFTADSTWFLMEFQFNEESRFEFKW